MVNREGEFPAELFDQDVARSTYIKHRIAQHLIGLTSQAVKDVKDPVLAGEIALLQAIKPHAIITTNYDPFLELVFPDYAPIIGQQIIRGGSMSIGEIFKIHGCVSQQSNLVFTKED